MCDFDCETWNFMWPYIIAKPPLDKRSFRPIRGLIWIWKPRFSSHKTKFLIKFAYGIERRFELQNLERTRDTNCYASIKKSNWPAFRFFTAVLIFHFSWSFDEIRIVFPRAIFYTHSYSQLYFLLNFYLKQLSYFFKFRIGHLLNRLGSTILYSFEIS